MAKVFIYADETGNLDYNNTGSGATPYFGFGTVMYTAQHGEAMVTGLEFRARMEANGVRTERGFHAIDDTRQTRVEVMKILGDHTPRVDVTLLHKPSAYDWVKQRGQIGLYKMAWYLHFKYLATNIMNPDDEYVVVISSIGTAAFNKQATEAIQDVCNQFDRKITICNWESRTAWGLQVADYFLWAVQRQVLRGDVTGYERWVEPHVKTCFRPWGTHLQR